MLRRQCQAFSCLLSDPSHRIVCTRTHARPSNTTLVGNDDSAGVGSESKNIDIPTAGTKSHNAIVFVLLLLLSAALTAMTELMLSHKYFSRVYSSRIFLPLALRYNFLARCVQCSMPVHYSKANTIQELFGPSRSAFTLLHFLQLYFPTVSEEFRLQFLNHEGSSDKCTEFDLSLDTTIIVPDENLTPFSKVSIRKHQSLVTLVDDAVASLVHRREKIGNEQNVLCFGYRFASDIRGKGVMMDWSAESSGPVVIEKFLNWTIDYWKTTFWLKILHERCGDQVLRTLLLQTSVFVIIESERSTKTRSTLQGLACAATRPFCSDNYLQISGSNICAHRRQRNNRQRKFPEPLQTVQFSNKKRRLTDTGEAELLALRTRQHIPPLISRSSLYCCESHFPRVGLPRHHILQRLTSSSLDSKSKEIVPPEEILLEALADVFDSKGRRLCHSTSRHRRRRHIKRWKRLRDKGKALCSEILSRHKKCDYHRLLDKYCPVSPLIDCLQVRSRQRLKPAQTISLLKQLAAEYTPPSNVTSFLTSVLKRVFPLEFWGSTQNFDRFLIDQLDPFVNLRQREDVAVKWLLKGIKIKEITWIYNNKNTSHKSTRSDHAAAENVFRNAIVWVFRDYLIPLLRSIFYITGSEMFGKKTLYYRRQTWALLRSLSMRSFLMNQYKELPQNEVLSRLATEKSTCSKLRLLPKASGVRPIVSLCNLRVLAKHGSHDSRGVLNIPRIVSKYVVQCTAARSSAMGWLDNVFSTLKFEYQRNSNIFGAGCHGLHCFYPK
jgi:hypothetical protein